jgi:hypothetical protein
MRMKCWFGHACYPRFLSYLVYAKVDILIRVMRECFVTTSKIYLEPLPLECPPQQAKDEELKSVWRFVDEQCSELLAVNR